MSLSVESATHNVVAQLKVMTDEQREQLFSKLRELYCIHCGCEQPKVGRLCQCWNDE